MFCGRTLQDQIDKIQKRALRILYNEPNLSLNDILEQKQCINIHTKNIITLLTEIYKTFNDENPPFIKEIFTKKVSSYNLRKSKPCNSSQNNHL